MNVTGEQALEMARSMMLSDPQDHNIQPMLHAQLTDNTATLMPLVAEDHDTGLNMHPVDCLELAVSMFRQENWDVEWAMMFSDSYGIHGEAGEFPQGLPRGSLEERFLFGDPNVYETMMVTCARRDGTYFYASQPYVRDRVTQLIVEWKEPDINEGGEGELQGRVIHLLREMVNDKYSLSLRLRN